MPLIIGCSHGAHLAPKVARLLKQPYSGMRTRIFPDGELYAKFQATVKGKDIILVQSFYGSINDCLMEVIFAAHTARELGAKKITLLAPYFPYLRQDKRFHAGETVSVEAVARLMDGALDGIIIMDPHLHRKDSLSEIFSIKAKKLTANDAIAGFIRKRVHNPAIVGPDWESYKWAQKIGEQIGCEYHILHKKRWSSHQVRIYLKKGVDLRRKSVVIVDDIISSGQTMLETIRQLKASGITDITVICVHGIFAENALERIKKAGAKVYSCNTIPNPAEKIDVSAILAEALSGWK
ncbi:ribose-phosphate diphosphokinase [Candidatus Woesearchaeota archaeon]|nr:ribose-phosphate diphosphokinase [Candidatus Woesearchaeota archaeon]